MPLRRQQLTFASSFILVFFAACGVFSVPVLAEMLEPAPNIVFEGMRTAFTPHGSGAIYGSIENSGTAADRLLKVETRIQGRAELHQTETDENGVKRMSSVDGGFALPAGSKLTLKSGGMHIMLFDVPVQPEAGGVLPVQLYFEVSGERDTEIPVVSLDKIHDTASHEGDHEHNAHSH